MNKTDNRIDCSMSSQPASIRKIKSKVPKSKVSIAVIIAVLYFVLNVIVGGRFFTVSNIFSVLTSSVVNTFIVLGFCFIFTMGIFDLSVGAIMILASNVGGILAINLGMGYFGLLAGSILTAVLLEAVNLKMIQITKIPAWIFGLGGTMVYEAIGSMYNSVQIAAGKQAVSLQDSCRGLGVPPANIVVLLLGLVFAYFLFNKTSIGFGSRALGSNQTVAGMMGVDINKTMLLAGIVGGVFLGLASAINESYSGRIVPTTGLNSIATIFVPLAAFLLAQALERIFNLTIAAIVSSVIITSIFNMLTLMNVPSGTWQKVIMGASVLICGMISQRDEKGVVK
ncbi:MAG: ABC transporter permease [Lawsonibacter sp.]